MSTLQEIARLVREELLTLIQPVQLLSVNPSKATGEVSGRFRSSSLLFDYSIKGGTVRYRPVGAGGRQDSVDVVEDAVGRLDAAARKPQTMRDSLLALRPDKPKAGKGRRKDSADADSEMLLGSLLASRQRLLARRLATYRHRVGLGR